MPNDIDRFLSQAPILVDGPSLGRIFAVERETWLLSEDPSVIAPRIDLFVSHRTALDAADAAREVAATYGTYGFHKPSGAWWASDRVRFHRFVVRPRPPGRGGAMLGSGLMAVGALAALVVFKAIKMGRQRPRSRA